jgi:hypothetical protein
MNLLQRSTLLALILAMPGSAWSQDPTQACDNLKSKAASLLGKTATLRCEAQGDTLTIIAPTVEAYEKLRLSEFPEYKYEGFKIAKPFHMLPMRDAVGPAESVVKFQSAALPTTKAVNYDGSVTATGGAFIRVGGPPGQTPQGGTQPEQVNPPVRRGPPGQQPQAPVDTAPRSGPPGQRPPSTRPGSGNDAPPQGGTQPPSKPTPVFIPAPPSPNYWNTLDWGTVPMWSSLPNDWESATVDEANGRYISRWYAYSRPFLRTVGHESVSRETRRRRGTDEVSFDLLSRDVLEVKQCYYQGVYRLKWNSFEGSWDGKFDHWRAACKVDRDHSDTGETAHVVVRFSMNGQELMPWETEVVRATFDGRSVGTSVQHPSYQYHQAPGGMPGRVTYEAGAKILTAPDDDGVTAELVPDHATKSLKLRLYDKWAGYYGGETLEVEATVIYVTPGWFTSNETSDERSFQNGTQIRQASGTPPGAAGAGARYEETMKAKAGCGTYFLESWSFRRANNGQPDNKSRISSDRVMHKGGAARFKLCK